MRFCIEEGVTNIQVYYNFWFEPLALIFVIFFFVICNGDLMQ